MVNYELIKAMQKIKIILFLSIVLLLALSCYRDPLEGYLTYRLVINNQSNNSYDVYQSSIDTVGGTFLFIGTLNANTSMTIRRLVTDVAYTFRLVEGDSVDQPIFEQVIQSKGDNITWNIGG